MTKTLTGFRKRFAGFTRMLAATVCLLASVSLAYAGEWRFPDVQRVVAVSDPHGAYADLILTLQSSGVIDDRLAWSGAETHLVLAGDMLDRGAESRQIMDLMKRLESEAIRAGGRVHVLLGNHEVMNLVGDLRYVADAEYAAFIEEESADERRFWYRHYWHYRQNSTNGDDPVLLETEFDEKAPPGYFGHRRAFRSDGEYGKWLLEKPLMIVINDTAYVHAGLPPYVAEHGLEGVNVALRADLIEFMAIRSALEETGVMSPVDGFRNHSASLMARITAGGMDDDAKTSALRSIELRDSPLHGSQGPLWYRGLSACSALTEGDSLSAALEKIGAARVVIGHTTTASHLIQQRMDGRVIEINTGMLTSSYGGSGYALIIENGEVSVASQDGEQDLRPIELPRRVGYRSASIDDDLIANVLANGEIEDLPTNGDARTRVSVVMAEETVVAEFNPLSEEDGFVPELAAYRLDRMLGLDMIPVTVRRDVGGKPGTLQFIPIKAMNERERLAAERGRNAPCALEKQRQTMAVFDALIHNPNRPLQSMLYHPGSRKLVLVDHESAFTTDPKLPDLHDNDALAIGSQWREALQELSDQRLRENLGEVLDEHRLRALASRRDALIAY